MEKLLTGKVALITGATRGIGRAIAETFAKQGSDVAFTYVSSDEKAKALEETLSKEGIKAKGYKVDGANFELVEKSIQRILEDFETIHVLVNNAGITKDNLLMRMTEEAWDQVMDANLKSVFNYTKSLQRTFLKNRSGSIINMSSVVGVVGQAGQSNYAASKAGVIGFSKSMAKELASRNIRCNVIAPGFIETEMTDLLDEKVISSWKEIIPLKRGGTTIEVANLALFLASDLSTYITGQVIHIDGGMVI